ncbi:MAG: hypothetical protein E6Q94_03140 [Burkholderiaceae bacterium]|nr:MAG: hypothetical protein E6Q94_03140 [Burkholderiaceae bacterium]
MSTDPGDDRPLITHDFKFSQQDIQQRIDWVDSEITQLSTSVGVSERLRALRSIHAQLIAQQTLITAMGK